MNAQRKHPSISPPVQVQTQPQPRGTQPYPPRGPTPPTAYRTGPGPEDYQLRQQVYQAQQFAGQSYSQGGSPHDMSKPPVPAHVPQGQNTPQGGVQNVVYTHTHGQRLTHPPPRFIQPTQTVSQNIRPGQQRPPMNMTTSPGQPMYNTPPMQPTFVLHHGHQWAPGGGGPQMIVQQGPGPMQVAYTRPGMQNHPFTIASQPGTFQMPNTPPYYNPSPQNSTVFFPQHNHGMQVQQQQQPQQPQRPMSTPNQLPYQSTRQKKIIRITDPQTGRDINEDIISTASSKTNTPPTSGQSSARATPVGSSDSITPPPSGDIAAQFAAQVAATLSPPKKGASAQPKPVVMQPQIPEQLPVELPVVVAPPAEPVVVEQMPEVVEAQEPEEVEPQVNEYSETPALTEVEETSEPTNLPVETTETKIITEVTPPSEEEVKQESIQEVDTNSTVEVVAETKSQEVEEIKQQEPPEEVTHTSIEVSETLTLKDAPAEPIEAPVEEEGEKVDTETEKAVENTVELEVTEVRTSEEPAALAAKPQVQPDNNNQTDTTDIPELDSATDKSAPLISKPPIAPVSTADKDADSKGKKSRRQKQRELNQKGESKEGTDMDAFTDSAGKESPPPVQNNVESKEEESDKVTEEENINKKEPEENVRKIEITVENNKVAEKNEKNDESTKTEQGQSESPANIEEPYIKKDKIELKYKYREDQWSPLNPEGKKSYDRNFLLQLQFIPDSMEKPEGLPKLPDVILDKPYSKVDQGRMTERSHPLRSGGFDFTPGFIKASPGGKLPNIGKRSSGQRGGGEKPRKIITHVSIGADVKLHSAENAWKPLKKLEVGNPEEMRKEELYRKVRSILNKLTPQKFQTLVTQILDLEVDSEETLKGVIDLIFEKAIDEPSFSVAYANMCKCLIQLKVPTGGNKQQETVTFRKLLLNRCQREFEKDHANEIDLANKQKEIDEAPDDKKKELELLMQEAAAKAKRRSLGNIRFIGELFKLKMLTENIMHDCLLKLLRSNDEDSLECLCRLLSTIGKDIDHDKAKPRMDQYFNQMDRIVKQKKVCSRVRFMIQDVMELRLNAWKPRRDENNPKTIDQIHREVQKEDQERALMLQQTAHHVGRRDRDRDRDRGRGRGNDRPDQRGGQGGPQGSEDGWTSVGKASRIQIDPSRMKLSKQNVDENIQLGPGGRGGFSGWGRGSSGGGSKTSSQESDRPPTPGNRFSALSGADGYGDSRGRGVGARGMSAGRDKGRTSQLGMPARGKTMARASQEQDREAAIAAARYGTLSAHQGSSRGTTPTGSRNQSRDNSRNREAPRDKEPEKPVKTVKELSKEELEKKTIAILDEFLHIQDIKEAVLCVKELESPNMIYVFVDLALNHVLERSSQARRQTGQLLHDLVKQNIISVDSYLKGLKNVLEFAEDMEIDIPKIWQYLGELIGPMVQDSSIPLSFLKSACEPCGKAATLVAEVLHDAAHRLGHVKVGDLWKASDLQWSDFISSKESIPDFIAKNKLEFTISEEAPRSPEVKVMPIEQVKVQLDDLIVKKNLENEEVFDWIETNIGEPRSREPQFIRALMTSVCSSAITGSGLTSKVDQTQITRRSILLQKYLDHLAELELQALYALQALVHKLDHPSGLLRTFFDTLYDEDIISEDAFNQWEDSKDPAEQAGKGVARTSVVQFFTWLREAEEDDQEEN